MVSGFFFHRGCSPPARVLRDAVPPLPALDGRREHDGDVQRDLQDDAEDEHEPLQERASARDAASAALAKSLVAPESTIVIVVVVPGRPGRERHALAALSPLSSLPATPRLGPRRRRRECVVLVDVVQHGVGGGHCRRGRGGRRSGSASVGILARLRGLGDRRFRIRTGCGRGEGFVEPLLSLGLAVLRHRARPCDAQAPRVEKGDSGRYHREQRSPSEWTKTQFQQIEPCPQTAFARDRSSRASPRFFGSNARRASRPRLRARPARRRAVVARTRAEAGTRALGSGVDLN